MTADPAGGSFPLRPSLSLLVLGFLVSVLSAFALPSPGYMDAEYYFVTGRRISERQGFTEPFLWNYLDDPTGLPHPSHHYWMPLTSILAGSGFLIFGESFRASQFAFVILTGLLPWMTAQIAFRLHADVRQSYRSAILAAVPGFFLPYFVTTDTFSPYAVLGGLALFLVARAKDEQRLIGWSLAGCTIALAHLTRADGLLLFVPALLALWGDRERLLPGLGALIVSYSLVMSPWWARNASVYGSIFPPGSTRALWQTTYDELFTYPAESLTFQSWISAGVGSILFVRLSALWTNIQRLIAENGLIFLGPFMVLGARRLWNKTLIRLCAAYLLALFLVMSLIFPFAGTRGGFFHSSAAVMPVLWALAPVGLWEAVEWGAEKRGWESGSAQRVFGAAALVMALVLTAGLFASKVFVPPVWGGSLTTYEQVGEQLSSLSEDPGIVMVNNPPGFYLATGIPAVVVPYGDTHTLDAVARRYGVQWVILDENHPRGLEGLYTDPDSVSWLKWKPPEQAESRRSVLIFRVLGVGEEVR